MSAGTAPVPFQPPNQAGAASGLSSAASSLGSLGQTTTGTAIPGYQAIYSAIQNNPYYAGAQANANQVGQTGQAFGSSELANAYGLQSLGQSLGQYAPNIAQVAFDPQNALYNRNYTTNQQQTNAILAQQGVAGSPYGAGEAIQSGQNFNIDWQNNEQARQNAGVAALGQLANTTAGLYGAAGDIGTAGLNTEYKSGQLPSQTYQGQQDAIGQALNQLVQGDVASGQPFVQQGGLDTQYLSIGQQASANALASFEAQQKADQAFWGGIGKLGSDALDAASLFI